MNPSPLISAHVTLAAEIARLETRDPALAAALAVFAAAVDMLAAAMVESQRRQAKAGVTKRAKRSSTRGGKRPPVSPRLKVVSRS